MSYKKLKQFIYESIIDPLQSTYDLHLFDDKNGEFYLKPDVQQDLINQINNLKSHLNIIKFSLIGSLVTHRYKENSDLDFNILIKANNSQMESLRKFISNQNGKTYPNTKHPINFHIVNTENEYTSANNDAEAIFDVLNNTFIKKESFKSFHISKYFNSFKKELSKINLMKNDLKIDSLDYNELKKKHPNKLNNLIKLIEKQIKLLEKDTLKLVDYYDDLKQNRRNAFKNPLTAKDIREYGSKNRLPENVIYKLLEKYYYLEFLEKIKEIIGNDRKLSNKEADKLVKFVTNV